MTTEKEQFRYQLETDIKAYFTELVRATCSEKKASELFHERTTLSDFLCSVSEIVACMSVEDIERRKRD